MTTDELLDMIARHQAKAVVAGIAPSDWSATSPIGSRHKTNQSDRMT